MIETVHSISIGGSIYYFTGEALTVLDPPSLVVVNPDKHDAKFERLAKKFIAEHPNCLVCGGNQWLQCHHFYPWHLYPQYRYDVSTFRTLCMGPWHCHLIAGHAGDFKAFNQQQDELVKLLAECRQKRIYTPGN
jgi:hypothetical protein